MKENISEKKKNDQLKTLTKLKKMPAKNKNSKTKNTKRKIFPYIPSIINQSFIFYKY